MSQLSQASSVPSFRRALLSHSAAFLAATAAMALVDGVPEPTTIVAKVAAECANVDPALVAFGAASSAMVVKVLDRQHGKAEKSLPLTSCHALDTNCLMGR